MSEIKDEMAGCGIHLDCTDDMSEIKEGGGPLTAVSGVSACSGLAPLLRTYAGAAGLHRVEEKGAPGSMYPLKGHIGADFPNFLPRILSPPTYGFTISWGLTTKPLIHGSLEGVPDPYCTTWHGMR